MNLAAANGQCDVLRLLLQCGANPNRKLPKHKGGSALHGISTGHSKPAVACLELLLQFGGNPNLANDDGETPMHLAVSMHRHLLQNSIHSNTLEMLLQFGGDPNLANSNRETAVHSPKASSRSPKTTIPCSLKSSSRSPKSTSPATQAKKQVVVDESGTFCTKSSGCTCLMCQKAYDMVLLSPPANQSFRICMA